MSAIDQTPTNKNFLSPLNFTLVLKRSPYLNFFVQQINLPSISLPTFTQPSPLLAINKPGDHLEYGVLRVSFKIDEDFVNYAEIYNWIVSLGYPENQNSYKALESNGVSSAEGLKSDISLIVLNGIKNPNYEIVFKDAFPIELSDATFQTTDDSIEYVTASVTFKYTIFNVNKL